MSSLSTPVTDSSEHAPSAAALRTRVAQRLFDDLDGRVVLATPLGVGKPIRLLNEIYDYAKNHREVRLTMVTALTLAEEMPGSDLARRLVDPIVDRLSGGGPNPAWRADQVSGNLPANVDIRDFYLTPGRSTGVAAAQQSHISANYQHVAGVLADMGANAIAQLVSPERAGTVSLGTNPDVSLRLLDHLDRERSSGVSTLKLAETAGEMPHLLGEALIDARRFDVLIPSDEPTPLFGIPNPPVDRTDAAIGCLAAALVGDGGTLQLGIGSLGDAVAAGIELRHRSPRRFTAVVEDLINPQGRESIGQLGGTESFSQGLYVASEMFSDSLLALEDCGVVSRRVSVDPVVQDTLNQLGGSGQPTLGLLRLLASRGVIDDPLTGTDVLRLVDAGIFDPAVSYRDGQLMNSSGAPLDSTIGEHLEGILNHDVAGPSIHAAFAAGSPDFYEALRERAGSLPLEMVDVGFTNTLLGAESVKRAQRHNARFINATMQVTCLGEAASDTLDDGRVVSGVGGQHDFVTQAHDLEGARSVVVARASREDRGRVASNIVWKHGHPTIPRHLRDIVVTEYGIADLRGKSDEETIAAMIEVADSRFQAELVEAAKETGKLPDNYSIPTAARQNRPDRIGEALRENPIPRYPFGSVLTDVEDELRMALRGMQAIGPRPSTWPSLNSVQAAVGSRPTRYRPHLRRLGLDKPKNFRERLMASAVVAALEESGVKDE